MKWKLEKRKLADLKEWPDNPRKMTDSGLSNLKESITKFGVAEPLVINSKGVICGGHGRLKVLRGMGIAEVDCYVPDPDLTEKEFQELNIRLNKNIAGEWDFDILAEKFEQNELLDWGFEKAEFGFNSSKGLTDEDAVPEVPIEPITKLGDIWLLGNHRLMCGDSTSIDAVGKLMGGGKADMVFTDPPYNLNYDFNNNGMVQSGQRTARFGKIQNDAMSDTDFDDFIHKAFTCILDNLRKGGSYYISGGRESTQIFNRILRNLKFHIQSWLVWKKENFNISRLDYHPKHEIITYGWKEGAAHRWFNDRSQTDILEYSREIGSSVHPTQKPIVLLEYLIKNSSLADETILDLFGGSGSTLIACEKTGRINRSMELDPKYCDVIIKRWQEYTSKEAILEATKETYNSLIPNVKQNVA